MASRLRVLAALLAAVTFGGSAAHAQTTAAQPKAVIELLTSQGCSSCPPADALFVELAKDPSVAVLAMPVTYWDYLGWKDTLGQDAFTKRQKHYAKVRGDGQVYTPQAVINGASHVVGSDKTDIERGLRQHGQALAATVSLQEEAGSLQIKLAGSGQQATTAGVWVVPISRVVIVPIARGENQGRSVSYTNVVRSMTRIGDWDGKDTVLTTPLATTRAPEADSYVVLVQAEQPGKYGMMPGAVLGAARNR